MQTQANQKVPSKDWQTKCLLLQDISILHVDNGRFIHMASHLTFIP